MSRRLSRRQAASIALKDLREIARLHASNGELLDADAWLFCLAHTLDSAPPGPLKINPLLTLEYGQWRGLDFDSLQRAAKDCSVDCTDCQISDYIEIVSTYRAKLPHALRYKLLKPDTYASKLGVTAKVRREAGATFVGAVDETAEDRSVRRKDMDRQYQAQKRQATGAVKRSEYEANSLTKTKPWEAAGVSRRTWYYRQKARDVASPSATSSANCTSASATSKGTIYVADGPVQS